MPRIKLAGGEEKCRNHLSSQASELVVPTAHELMGSSGGP
jgi:hypothetical protein